VSFVAKDEINYSTVQNLPRPTVQAQFNGPETINLAETDCSESHSNSDADIIESLQGSASSKNSNFLHAHVIMSMQDDGRISLD